MNGCSPNRIRRQGAALFLAATLAALAGSLAGSATDSVSGSGPTPAASHLDTTAFAADSSVYLDIDVPRDAPASSNTGKTAHSAHAVHPTGKTKTAPKARTSSPRTVDIPSGCFWMGSPEGFGNANEHPRHRVCLDSFRMDRLPVTQKVFVAATGQSPWLLCTGPTCAGSDPRAPAWFVTWDEAADFCHSRSGRLPTEAEYEYAARAGDSGAYIWGDTAAKSCLYANLADKSLERMLPAWKVFPCDDGEPLVAPAGGYRPNRWGLFDMAGNVWEWTSDWYAADAYAHSASQNPQGPDSGSGRVIRGGSWLSSPDGGRAAYRDGFRPDGRYNGAIGFRCVYPQR
ncbi:MAG TPA: SUMF1/EgtB/PvdO family nonheme iron enzyme [Fibrobacteria bacterium]|nr:SUMF1/EgtB/PvdO family nonheme iron enzyme [Fibrobacteria bacterium]